MASSFEWIKLVVMVRQVAKLVMKCGDYEEKQWRTFLQKEGAPVVGR
jgi:hypothetical protein